MSTRTEAGEILAYILKAHTTDPEVPGTFQEGEKDTASAWVRTDDGKYFQIHVTELNPTEDELAFYRRSNR